MDIEITKNKYNFKLENLLEIGKRANNPKRNFLFISKLLGKHIIVKADMVKAAGVLLASLKYEELKNNNLISYVKHGQADISKEIKQQTKKKHNVLVIGFAETATGLGMGVASVIKGCTYQTTTREPVTGLKNLLSFQEEHSHATEHKCFSILDKDFSEYDEIILVDDEITTGRTILNLIADINKNYKVKNYSVLTILDWRSGNDSERYKEFQRKHGIKISVSSLISGKIHNKDKTVYKSKEPTVVTQPMSTAFMDALDTVPVKIQYEDNHIYTEVKYFRNSGRFGVKQKDIKSLEKVCQKISERLKGKEGEKILILGHGEDIYIPSRVASYLGADFRTTTRSPILCDGNTIKHSSCFFDKGVKYYFYNKEEIEREYDRVIMLTEQPLPIKLCNNMESLNI